MTPSHVRYRAAPRPDLRRELSQNLRSPSRSEACAERAQTLTDAPERLGVRPLLGLNVSTLRAVISIDSPVWGLRPRRDAFFRMRKCPKPTILTSSPRSKHRKMMSKTDSTTEDD